MNGGSRRESNKGGRREVKKEERERTRERERKAERTTGLVRVELVWEEAVPVRDWEQSE